MTKKNNQQVAQKPFIDLSQLNQLIANYSKKKHVAK
ncbi:hypothetical protein Ga0466249_003884 [Sporomusaceae bacterium BoRhaA]|nr:hypothetical protein [Pelorhabdus rhamnosifermentans]